MDDFVYDFVYFIIRKTLLLNRLQSLKMIKRMDRYTMKCIGKAKNQQNLKGISR